MTVGCSELDLMEKWVPGITTAARLLPRVRSWRNSISATICLAVAHARKDHLLQQQCMMVRLTITAAILRALEELQDRGQVPEALSEASEPSLDQPATGNPITHGQIIAISKALKEINIHASNGKFDTHVSYHLDDLLRGSKVYVEPPKPKLEPVGSMYILLHYAVSLISSRLRSTRP